MRLAWTGLGLLFVALAQAQDAEVRIVQPAERYLIGEMPVEISVTPARGESVESVEVRLDGRLIETFRKPPYRLRQDFGEQLEPHKLEVLARFSDGSTRRASVEGAGADLSFASQVRLVTLSVAVQDRDGRYVMDLEQSRFRVLENGRPQKLSHFAREALPLKLALTLDCSGSMEPRLTALKAAASRFIDRKQPEDEMMIVRFNQVPGLARAFTARGASLKSAIGLLRTSGGTRIYDAVYASLMALKTVRGQRAVVLLTDGVDESASAEGSGANVSIEEAIESSRKLQVPIYAIGLGQHVDATALELLASRTGGRAYFPDAAEDMEQAYDQIRSDLDHRYTLAYVSGNKPVPGQWMRVEVRLDDPWLTVQHPEGYVFDDEDSGGP